MTSAIRDGDGPTVLPASASAGRGPADRQPRRRIGRPRAKREAPVLTLRQPERPSEALAAGAPCPSRARAGLSGKAKRLFVEALAELLVCDLMKHPPSP